MVFSIPLGTGDMGSWVWERRTSPINSSPLSVHASSSTTSKRYVQLKSEVYIHLSQIHLNSVFHNCWHVILVKIPVLGQLGSPLYSKNVKCQNNSREWFISAFISFITFPVGETFTYTLLLFGSIAFKLFYFGQTFRVAFHKLPTISWVNFGPFLLTELV